MLEYILPFVIYILSPVLIQTWTQNQFYVFIGKVFFTGLAILFFWKKYNIKWKFSKLSFFAGVLIFGFWVTLEGYYPLIGTPVPFIPVNLLEVIIRLVSLLIIAPIIEELFTRSFLNRYLIAKKWRKLPIESSTSISFVVTVLYFGFSHSRWLPGLIAGVILNLLLIKKKNISECIFSHFIANLCLSIYIISTQNWIFW